MTGTNAQMPPVADRDGRSPRRDAAAMIKEGRNGEAVRLLQQALGRTPADPDLNYMLGVAAYRFGDYATAQTAFERSVNLAPTAPGLYGLGLTLRHRGWNDAARGAFNAALKADPGLDEARRQLAGLAAEGAHPGGSLLPPDVRPATTSSKATVDESMNVSLADLLDDRRRQRPDDFTLAGGLVWAGRPSVRWLVGGALGAVLLLLVPELVHSAASGLPSGPVRDAVASLWRITAAAALPASFVLVAVVTAKWATRSYVLRRHRIEVFSGVFRRQHVVLWLHDLERPVVIERNLRELVLGLGTVHLNSTILPPRRGLRQAGRPGNILVSGLPIDVAERLGGLIRAEAMWQRRKMVGNFVSSR